MMGIQKLRSCETPSSPVSFPLRIISLISSVSKGPSTFPVLRLMW